MNTAQLIDNLYKMRKQALYSVVYGNVNDRHLLWLFHKELVATDRVLKKPSIVSFIIDAELRKGSFQ